MSGLQPEGTMCGRGNRGEVDSVLSGGWVSPVKERLDGSSDKDQASAGKIKYFKEFRIIRMK